MSFMSAIIHDYEHRGVNNDFLIKSHDDLAVLYNDHSPMENHHLASAFGLMKDDSYDFLKGLQPKLRTNLRKQVIDMVLATDMKQVECYRDCRILFDVLLSGHGSALCGPPFLCVVTYSYVPF